MPIRLPFEREMRTPLSGEFSKKTLDTASAIDKIVTHVDALGDLTKETCRQDFLEWR